MSPQTAVGAGVLAQANSDEYQGHFFDRFVDTVTSLEAGDRVIDWGTTGVEWLVVIALIAVPALMIFGGVRGRRYGLAAGGLIGGLAVWWYRTRPEEIVASGYRTFTRDGETFQCLDATVDSEGDLLECSSGLVAQIRQNTVLDRWEIPVGDWVEQTVFWVDNNLKDTLDVIRWPFLRLLNVIVDDWLLGMSWLTICFVVFALGWAIRNFQIGALCFVGLLICGLLGQAYWRETALTLGFISVSVLLCVIIGIPLGVLCGRVDGAWKVVRPVLDAMQVVHSFVYMLPFIFFFTVGWVPATMVTMTFALPPLVRLTNLGIRQVPEDVVEASRAYGAPEWRVLTDVQLPLARPAIMTGLNQTLLLSISMLGIAAIMGAGGLGRLLFQAIANLDLPQAGSAGLAFFLVAVVLDRLTQTDADSSNLLSRMAKAWANWRTPENLLEEAQATADEKIVKLAEEPVAPEEAFIPATGVERGAIIATGVGALVLLVALLLPWSVDAGLVSSYARGADVDLRTEQCTGEWIETTALDPLAGVAAPALTCTSDIEWISNSFNGVSASGGSWFGIFAAMAAAVVAWSAINTLWRPGSGSQWFSAHGAVVFSMAALGTSLMYLLANPPDSVIVYSTGVGVWVAVAGALIAAIGAVAWLWRAPMTARRPLAAGIGWGRLIGAVSAVLLLILGGYSGWSFDTRTESVIGPELRAELNQIAAEGAAAQAEAVVAGRESDEAEAAGDVERAAELHRIEIDALALAGVRGADITSAIAKAERTGDVIHDGYERTGAGLGIWTLIAGIAALGLSLPAIGVFGIDEVLRYRWGTLVAGVGLAIAVIPLSWIVTIVRVADPKFVSGVGAVFVMAAGGTIFASTLGTLSEFQRNKSYDDIPEAASNA